MRIMTLGDERVLSIRKAHKNDAQELLGFLNEIGGETDYLLFGHDEFLDFSVEQEEEFLENMEKSRLQLLGILDGKLAAVGSLTIPSSKRLSHTCELSIAVKKEFWNQGIGTAFLKELLCQAEQKGIEIVHLGVRSDNVAAINLYNRFGFESAGVFQKQIKIENEYYDEIQMLRSLNKGEFYKESANAADSEFLKKLDQWHEDDEFQNIVEAISSIDKESRDYDLNNRLARALNNMGRYAEAELCLLELADQGEQDYLWCFRLGYAYYYQKKYQLAIDALEKAVKLKEDFSDNWLFLCLALRQTGQKERFSEASQIVRELAPADWEQYFVGLYGSNKKKLKWEK